ncbi:MAG: SPFH domain-containing protein [Propionibacteriaceae bacterium]|jgi:membrane protease subunit (stomatin/prohibitin family)|nr:SPFH domain-containing protein [Propionibacteriaceae bacterium]
MGLIKAAIGAVGGVLADSWRDYFYCDSLDPAVLMAKGHKRTDRGSNKKSSDNVISNGSIINVNQGQCAIIVDKGLVTELCAEPGEFLWEASTEPSLFYGPLSQTIPATFERLGRRIAFGGGAGTDQRVYYFNTKEILGNKYGTANPVPFRVVDRNIGLDVDIAIRVNGEYSYRIEDPILFYANVAGNVTEEFRREQIDSQLKAELLTALQPALAQISEIGVRYSALPGHTTELAQILNDVLSQKWRDSRGLRVASFAVNSATASPEDEDMIKRLQASAVMRDPTLAAANIVAAQADAMRTAAANEAGAMTGFMGFGLAQQAGGVNPQDLFALGQQQAAAPPAAPPAAGAGAPAATGLVYRCDKCGWQPTEAGPLPNFCPSCGDPFNAADVALG